MEVENKNESGKREGGWGGGVAGNGRVEVSGPVKTGRDGLIGRVGKIGS